jgi:putative Mg2+ transporter-C (MgtC) family protein
VVAGIGFIGAGAIIRREGGIVEGLTTAATIWAVAAIGLAAGIGLYIISAATTAVVTIVLLLPHPIR